MIASYASNKEGRAIKRPVFFLRILVCLTFLFATPLHAQELLDLLGNFARQAAGEQGAKLKLRIDSIDFQFAFSVSENAGFFDLQNKGEGKARVLADLKSAYEKSAIETARDTLEFGLGQYGIRRYKTAERSFNNARNLLEREGLTNNLVYLRVTSCLGLIYLVQGRWAEADKYISASLDKSLQTLGKQSAAYIANLNNMAKFHQSMGRYNEAEQEFAEAFRLSESFFGGSMQTAIILNNQAMLAHMLGRAEQAQKQMSAAMNYAQQAPKKIIEGQSFDNRRFQLNLGIMMQSQGNLAEAENIFAGIKKASDLRGQTKSQEYGTLLNLLGNVYAQMNETEKAEEHLLKSLEVFRRRFTDNNYLSARVLDDLGNFYRMRGNYAEAEKRLQASLTMRGGLFKDTHPDYVKSQEALAILYWKTGKKQQAYTLYKQVMDKTMLFIDEYFAPMSESEKSRYWSMMESRFQRFYNFALDVSPQIPAVVNDFYQYHLDTKAILFNATSKVRRAIFNSQNTALKSDYQAWIDLKEQLTEAFSYSVSKLKAQKIDVEALEQQANQLEKSLATRSAVFAGEYNKQHADIRQLAALLGEEEAIVDVVRVTKYDQDFQNDLRYVVFIQTNKTGVPRMLVLEDGKTLEGKAFRLYHNAMKTSLEETTTYQAFWAKVEPEVAAKKKIYLSPDGVYNQINVNTLFDGENYVIDKHDIVTIGNVKDLGEKPQSKGAVKALLIGFPNYGSGFTSLPGTQAELENISKVLKTGGYEAITYIQNEASEKKVKSVAAPSILHVASHGYFIPDADTTSVFGVASQSAARNPLLRSGLILTEASKKDSPMPDLASNDNGYLTAYESMNLNLEGTKLVILSACETALGEVKSGEGVYGLQRAFKMAGAEVVVMSLWKVDDAATQVLMTTFYKEWIVAGDFQKAFKTAQIKLKKEYPQPYFWGAFVMTGI